MEEAFEEVGVVFMPDEQTTPVAEPTDGPFDFPTMLVAAERASILSRRFLSTVAMWCDLFDTARFERVAEPLPSQDSNYRTKEELFGVVDEHAL